MPYITVKQSPSHHQISFEDILAGIKDLSKYVFANPTNTRTYYARADSQELLDGADREYMLSLLRAFNQGHETLFARDRPSLYRTFHIPKHGGGLRRIDAPVQELMDALRQLKSLFE